MLSPSGAACPPWICTTRSPVPFTESQPRNSFVSPGDFLVQIPRDSNSESLSCQNPGLQSCFAQKPAMAGERGSGGGETWEVPGVSFGDRFSHRPLQCATSPITSPTRALSQGLSRESRASGCVLDLSPSGPHLASVSPSADSSSSGMKRCFPEFL